MESHQREFLVSQIRSGFIFLDRGLRLKPCDIILHTESLLVYDEAYNAALDNEIMTLNESIDYLSSQKIYTEQHKILQITLEKTIENDQCELYENRQNTKLVDKLKKQIVNNKNKIAQINTIKNSLYENTCESYAESRKLEYLLPKLLVVTNKKHAYYQKRPQLLSSLFIKAILSEKIIRELILNEPWRSCWTIRKQQKLFPYNTKHELNFNQKSILLWTTAYDNIRQSLDAPEEKYYEDNDIIDAWFIWSKKKREKEKLKQDIENDISKNSKIANASQVFVPLNGNRSAEDIYSLNDAGNAQHIQRLVSEINSKGSVKLEESEVEKHRHLMSKGSQ